MEKRMCDSINYETELKQNGLKVTKSRMAILDILIQSDQPIDAEQVFLGLKEKMIETNLSTVYRTLDTLEEKGLVTKISMINDDRKLFEYNRLGHRHYLVCIDCKKIVTIHSCPLHSYEKTLEDETNFSIVGHKLYLYGYCYDCQKKKMV